MTFIARNRPLLREGIDPILTIKKPREAGNVLDHAEILVIGLFHQKAIVLDSWLTGCLRTLFLRGAAQTKKDRNYHERSELENHSQTITSCFEPIHSASFAASLKMRTNIGRVNFPVCVFWLDG